MDLPEPSILIVDDDVNDQVFIQRALKRSGVANRISVVNDGEEAITYLQGVGLYENRQLHPFPSVIITDVKMPRMGGIELLRWMNSRPEFRLIPAVVLTSSNDNADITAAFSYGAKGYMIKPVQFGELEKVVRTIADYWRTSCIPCLVKPDPLEAARE